MKTTAIIQARMTSNRLPGKVLMDLDGKPALQRVIERVRQSKVDDIIVATTTNDSDNPIIELCNSLNCNWFRGSEDDVLSRVLLAAESSNTDLIVEITADCPLIEPRIIDTLLNMYFTSREEIRNRLIVGNITVERTFPRGQDIRIFSTKALSIVNDEVDNPIDRQHVSTFMYANPKSKSNYFQLNWKAPKSCERPDIDITLDTLEDYELINWLFVAGREYKLELTCEDVISLIDTYPDKYKKVAEIKRKDYFQELNDYYSKELKENESTDSRVRQSGGISGRTRKR